MILLLKVVVLRNMFDSFVCLVNFGVNFAGFRASSGFMSVTVSMARGMAVIRKNMKTGKLLHKIQNFQKINPTGSLMIPMISVTYFPTYFPRQEKYCHILIEVAE